MGDILHYAAVRHLPNKVAVRHLAMPCTSIPSLSWNMFTAKIVLLQLKPLGGNAPSQRSDENDEDDSDASFFSSLVNEANLNEVMHVVKVTDGSDAQLEMGMGTR